MPKKSKLMQLTDAEIAKRPGRRSQKKIKADFPKTKKTAAKARSAQTKWIKGQKAPQAPRMKEFKVQGVALKATHVASIRAVHESGAPTAEFVGQKFTPDKFFGELYSSLASLEYRNLQGEYRKRKKAARSPAAKAKVEAQWQKVVAAGGEAFGAVGVSNVSQTKLNTFSKELAKSKSNFNAVQTIANTGAAVGASKASFKGITAGFLPHTAVLPDLDLVQIPIPWDICEEPLLDGKYTKHMSKSFSLKVTMKVWCPKWNNPFRTCKKTFTVAGASFSLALEVGYKVTCCGATAWGSADAEACVTVIGIKVCAGCTAKVVGVAGLTKTSSGSKCSYGLGVTAELKCTLAGLTVFYASVPFGWTLTGPCPPAIIPCP